MLTFLNIGLKGEDQFLCIDFPGYRPMAEGSVSYLLTFLNVDLSERDRVLYVDFPEYRPEGQGSVFMYCPPEY